MPPPPHTAHGAGPRLLAAHSRPSHPKQKRYPVAGSPGEFLPVATTRPETILGDTAVAGACARGGGGCGGEGRVPLLQGRGGVPHCGTGASSRVSRNEVVRPRLPSPHTHARAMRPPCARAVHPEDPRYARFVGLQLEVPMGGGRTVPVIADDYVDREFGTGALKITPGGAAAALGGRGVRSRLRRHINRHPSTYTPHPRPQATTPTTTRSASAWALRPSTS